MPVATIATRSAHLYKRAITKAAAHRTATLAIAGLVIVTVASAGAYGFNSRNASQTALASNATGSSVTSNNDKTGQNAASNDQSSTGQNNQQTESSANSSTSEANKTATASSATQSNPTQASQSKPGTAPSPSPAASPKQNNNPGIKPIPGPSSVSTVTAISLSPTSSACMSYGGFYTGYSYSMEISYGAGAPLNAYWEVSDGSAPSLPSFSVSSISSGTVRISDTLANHNGFNSSTSGTYNVRLRITAPNSIVSNWITIPRNTSNC